MNELCFLCKGALKVLSPILGAGAGDVSVVIVDPQNKNNTVEVILENKGDNIFRCTYKPVQEGPHTIHVTFAGQPIPSSPFKVHISEGKHLIVLVNVAVFPVVSINVLVILKERATIKNQNKTKKQLFIL